MTDEKISEVLSFWFEEIDHSCWFKVNPEFDQELERRFGAMLLRARNDELDRWCETAAGRLAHIVVLDQFSRNIHRGHHWLSPAIPGHCSFVLPVLNLVQTRN